MENLNSSHFYWSQTYLLDLRLSNVEVTESLVKEMRLVFSKFKGKINKWHML